MPLPSRQTLLNLGETLLIGTIGGAVLTYAGIPAGWLSGAMIAVAIAALAGRPMAVPAPLARVVFVLIGISLGGAVTPETLKGVATWPLSVVLLCIGMICAMFGSACLSEEGAWLGPCCPALFGSAPGALSQVMAYATQYHSDLARHRDRADHPRGDSDRLAAGGAGPVRADPDGAGAARSFAISEFAPGNRDSGRRLDRGRDPCAFRALPRRTDFRGDAGVGGPAWLAG